MNETPVVLIVTPAFAPQNSSLSLRISKLAKYLAREGWHPVVLTTDSSWPAELPVELPAGDIYRARNLDPMELALRLRDAMKAKKRRGLAGLPPDGRGRRKPLVKLLRDAYWYFFSFPDRGIWWYLPAVIMGRRIVRERRPAAVFSLAGYFSVHLAASRIAGAYGLPWIASFDDPWDEGYYFKRIKPLDDLEMGIKRRTIAKASALAASTEPETSILRRAFGKHSVFLPHGFDPEMMKPAPAKTGGKFILAHTGILHDLRRDPRPLFEALRSLKNDGSIDANSFELRLIGPDSRLADAMAGEFGLRDIVRLSGRLTYDETLRKQREASALLLIGGTSTMRTCPLKLFEYFGARRPVLYLSRMTDEDYPARLVREAGAGITVRSPREARDVIAGWMRDAGRGRAPGPVPTEASLQRYTWEVPARALAAALAQCLQKEESPEAGRVIKAGRT